MDKETPKPIPELVTALAEKTLERLDVDNWEMSCDSRLMPTGKTHIYFKFTIKEGCVPLVDNSDIKQVMSFATLTEAFQWYITTDFDTKQPQFAVSIAI
jgi:hypothetical protein